MVKLLVKLSPRRVCSCPMTKEVSGRPAKAGGVEGRGHSLAPRSSEGGGGGGLGVVVVV